MLKLPAVWRGRGIAPHWFRIVFVVRLENTNVIPNVADSNASVVNRGSSGSRSDKERSGRRIERRKDAVNKFKGGEALARRSV